MSDLGPLREWWVKNKFNFLGDTSIAWKRELRAALKAAGVIEDEPDVELAFRWLLGTSHLEGCTYATGSCICGKNATRRIIERAREAK